jgi:hypothetical protein
MDRSEEDVIIACRLYLLSQEEKQEKRRKYWVHKYLEHGKKKGNFTLFLDDSKMTAKSCSNILE